jgi:hypothetical protein
MQTFQGALLYERDFATSVFSADALELLDIAESPLHSKNDGHHIKAMIRKTTDQIKTLRL